MRDWTIQAWHDDQPGKFLDPGLNQGTSGKPPGLASGHPRLPESDAEAEVDPQSAGWFGNCVACLWFCCVGCLASLCAWWERVRK